MTDSTLFMVIACWMLLMSAILFILFGVDKRRAEKNEWRIRERTLFLFALLGGALGGVIGMSVFRHKTKHTSFAIGMPLLLVLNLACVFLVFYLRK